MIDHSDFPVIVKQSAPRPRSWRWEIYRAGRTSPIERSKVLFDSVTEATRAGKVALSLLLSEYPKSSYPFFTGSERFDKHLPMSI